MQKIGFFTAGKVATPEELAEIAQIREDIAPKYDLVVMNGTANPNYGEGRPLPVDLVAGTVPGVYSEVPEYVPEV